MITLYDNAFSPFARKVRMILRYKEIGFASIDALAKDNLAKLEMINGRAEVPVLISGDQIIADSADIVAFIEDAFPQSPLEPKDIPLRVKAREWQRIADTVLDAIVHDISLWGWPTHARTDTPPEGLLKTGMTDIENVLAYFERSFGDGAYPCEEICYADFALFAHVSAVRSLGFSLEPQKFPKMLGWYQRMKSMGVVQRDLQHIKHTLKEKFTSLGSPYESLKVVWRGDRLEWLFAKGYAGWWFDEYRNGRVAVPDAVPRGSEMN